MRAIIIGCFFALLGVQVSAQTIAATVKDSLTREPVVFVRVSIRGLGSDTGTQMTVTDRRGRFTFVNLHPGNFEIALACSGYISIRLPVIVRGNAGSIDLGTVFLVPRPETLKEVVVDGKREIIEEKLDRTVYNVERDKSLTGGDATDALRRMPLLSVDIDGNVTLRGSSNIKVLINNKPSTITANNLADALKQIPADQIRSVEVITSASVKYDADGSVGIININLKQDRLQGILLNPDMAIGTRASFLGINGAYNDKKMSFSIGGFGRATYKVTGTYENVQSVGGGRIDQQAATRKHELTDNYNMGWEYSVDKNDFFNAAVRYSQFNSHNDQDHLVTNFYEGSALDSSILNQVEIIGKTGTVDATLDFTHEFARAQRELSFLTLFSYTSGTNSYTNARESPTDGSLIGWLVNDNVSSNREITLQVDYQTPLDSNQLLEFGGKYIMREVISDYPANRFDYRQNVTAGYLEYTRNTHSPFSFRAGVRYEYAAISAGLRDPGASLPGIPSYGVVVPAANIGWRLKNGKLIKFGYTRRTQRPSIQFLNPFRVTADPGSLVTGDPALGPEHSNNFELSYNTAIGDMAIGFSGFYRHTSKAIESISIPVPGGDTVERTFANIGKESTEGLNLFANLNLGQKLSLDGGAALYYAQLENNGPSAGSAGPGPPPAGPPAHNTGWVFSANLSGGYTFIKTWTLYLYSYFRGSQVLLQGYQTGFPYYSLTLKRDLPKKRGSIGLGAENFLARTIAVSAVLKSETLSQSTTNRNHTLSLRLYMSLTIGKLRVEREERQKKSILNDDLKK